MTTSARRKLLVLPLAAAIGFGGVLAAGTAAFADEAPVVPTATATATPDPTPTPGPTGTATPIPVPTEIDLLTPEAGKPAIARTVIFGGTAPAGAVITVTGADKTVLGTTTVGELNAFVLTYTYGDDATTKQTVTVTGVLDGAELNTVKRSFTLPEQNLPAPVITAPVAGSTVYGSQVTFTGTGTPGKNVIVAALPTASLGAAAEARSAEVPADPADPIIVDADGTWSVTLSAAPEDYTATAVLADIDDDGQLVSLISPPSAPVQFVLAPTPVAPVVVVTPVPTPTATATASASGDRLAETGLDALGLVAAAGALGLAGVGLLATRRRKA